MAVSPVYDLELVQVEYGDSDALAEFSRNAYVVGVLADRFRTVSALDGREGVAAARSVQPLPGSSRRGSLVTSSRTACGRAFRSGVRNGRGGRLVPTGQRSTTAEDLVTKGQAVALNVACTLTLVSPLIAGRSSHDKVPASSVSE